jgi:hypothetical protein
MPESKALLSDSRPLSSGATVSSRIIRSVSIEVSLTLSSSLSALSQPDRVESLSNAKRRVLPQFSGGLIRKSARPHIEFIFDSIERPSKNLSADSFRRRGGNRHRT